jgi:7 transmembrane receptor (rhodopsin family)
VAFPWNFTTSGTNTNSSSVKLSAYLEMQSMRCQPTQRFSQVGNQLCLISIFKIISISVTAFTIERYVAICHPFLSHTMSKLSRAIKFIFFIWILSIFFATPLAIQTGIVTDPNNQETSWCSIVPEREFIANSFVIATVLFFFTPMTLITVLYLLIGMKLRQSTLIKRENGNVVRNNNLQSNVQSITSQSTKRVIKMLGELIFNQNSVIYINICAIMTSFLYFW